MTERSGLEISGTVILGDFDLDLELQLFPGEVVVVLGPNGAGKTTLARTIAGLTALTTGELRLNDAVLDGPGQNIWVPPADRPVGVVFQDYRLFPRMTLRDNVAFGPRVAGRSKREARAVADRWLDRVGLAALAGRRPHDISGGQAQRVALARALARDPGVLVLDEPLAALDAATRTAIRNDVREHLTTFGGPVILVTHDPVDALVLADRAIVLEDGRVRQDAAPLAVARRPATQWAAGLFGLNFYTGVLAGDGAVDLAGGGRLFATTPTGMAPGPAVVSLRPSAITVHMRRPAPSSPRNVWPGRIRAVEMHGDRVRLDVDGIPPALVDVTPAAVAELDLRPGREVWLSAKATETEAYGGGPTPGTGE